MSGLRAKRLRMVAGPNGSGKSSIIRNLAKQRWVNGVFWLSHYLNADDVERALVSSGFDLSQFDTGRVAGADLASRKPPNRSRQQRGLSQSRCAPRYTLAHRDWQPQRGGNRPAQGQATNGSAALGSRATQNRKP